MATYWIAILEHNNKQVASFMGVTSLWEILDPAGEKGLHLSELAEKSLAVDLSAWIVEMKTAGSAAGVRNILIRSLFFRILDFLKLGIKLVFVIDGRAPDVKHKVMVQRQQQQFGSMATTLVSPDRPSMLGDVKRCTELFDCLSIPYIYSPGEAEALGAYLSKHKKVDGFISQDSDFFCYGGEILIKDLKKDNKNYHYDMYGMEKIEKDLHLNQRDLITLALLLGCDYDKEGVKFIGKQKAMDLLEYFRNKHVDSLDRIMGWHGNKELDDIESKMTSKEKKEPHCVKCEHLGRVNMHERTGCSVCETELDCVDACDTVCCNCDWHEKTRHLNQFKIEINTRKKTCTENNNKFPDKKIIEEYLQSGIEYRKEMTDWTQQEPDIKKTINYLTTHTSWSGEQVMQYLVPALLQSSLRTREASDIEFKPLRICRACKENHLKCYEVEWKKLACDRWTETDSMTIKVERGLLEGKFPELVKSFEAACQSSKKSSGKKRKGDQDKGQTKITAFTKIRKKLEFTKVGSFPEKNINTIISTSNSLHKTNIKDQRRTCKSNLFAEVINIDSDSD